MTSRLTLGPIPFHWPAEQKLDFYARIADEAPVDVVYLGEVICSKRAPFMEPHYDEIAQRLERGGKEVVFSTLSEVMLKRERKATQGMCGISEHDVEINDSSGLLYIEQRPHRIGPLMNVYNEETMRYLAAKGAFHFSLPVEMPREAVAYLAPHAAALGVGLEVQVFGRASLAVSARCYHARAHGRTKDNCQFVCEDDPDGMVLKTASGQDFLAVNGIQTLSGTYVNLLQELADIQDMGIGHFRIMPHDLDMVVVARIFRDVLDQHLPPEEGQVRLDALDVSGGFSNGFWHGAAGHLNVQSGVAG